MAQSQLNQVLIPYSTIAYLQQAGILISLFTFIIMSSKTLFYKWVVGVGLMAAKSTQSIS
jgi:hypothetical protein